LVKDNLSMAILRDFKYVPLVALKDPDDYRTDSEMAFVADEERPDGKHVSMACIFERIGVGERIPPHTHPTTDEIVIVDEGTGEAILGNEKQTVTRGCVIFIPAGTLHGIRNSGQTDFRMHAIFPTAEVSVEMVERNPAPGTEGEPPLPPYTVNLREGWNTLQSS
jgi:quercetin dioxygenase-like cupin family protein